MTATPEGPTAADPVDRDFTRAAPNEFWITDTTEHRTRESKVCCVVVLDAFSRRVVGWSIDSRQDAAPVTTALGMALHNCEATPGTVIHSDHRVQYTSWAFTRHVKESGLLPSTGSIGDCFDNAMTESFRGRMQTELPDRRRRHTPVNPANAIFGYLEVFHNRQRRHSAPGMLTPVEPERLHTVPTMA